VGFAHTIPINKSENALDENQALRSYRETRQRKALGLAGRLGHWTQSDRVASRR